MSIIGVNKNNFDDEVLNYNKKVLVDFNANWCGPCRMLKPILDEIAIDNKEIKIVSINVDDEEELSSKYNVVSIPCLVLFENGKEIKRSIGLVSKDDILTMIGGK